MNLFLTIIATGIPGFISYWYLSKIGLVYFDKDKKDEKVVALGALSLLNMGLSIFLMYLVADQFFNKKIDFFKLDIYSSVILFLIACIVSFLLTYFVYPKVLEKVNTSVEKKLDKDLVPYTTNKPTIEHLLQNPTFPYNSVYIFKNDDKKTFVESGVLERLSVTEGSFKMSISPNTFSTEEDFKYKEVRALFNGEHYTKDRKHIYFDFDRNLIIFIFNEDMSG
ncbi:hypothetical protein IW492_01585 [Enterococcus sp. BWB1-3]|uniref:hypothetical protein n=1 Tax=Enterococcus sp. BWB1-3 TaxID=2787713 RepID=UPI0019222B5A|nr:hypothetical protein [Enterococcus sp. BWB1-3]MBL1227920.1 hypothetical protein [Enterococcus sp. BWB1-3]